MIIQGGYITHVISVTIINDGFILIKTSCNDDDRPFVYVINTALQLRFIGYIPNDNDNMIFGFSKHSAYLRLDDENSEWLTRNWCIPYESYQYAEDVIINETNLYSHQFIFSHDIILRYSKEDLTRYYVIKNHDKHDVWDLIMMLFVKSSDHLHLIIADMIEIK